MHMLLLKDQSRICFFVYWSRLPLYHKFWKALKSIIILQRKTLLDLYVQGDPRPRAFMEIRSTWAPALGALISKNTMGLGTYLLYNFTIMRDLIGHHVPCPNSPNFIYDSILSLLALCSWNSTQTMR